MEALTEVTSTIGTSLKIENAAPEKALSKKEEQRMNQRVKRKKGKANKLRATAAGIKSHEVSFMMGGKSADTAARMGMIR